MEHPRVITPDNEQGGICEKSIRRPTPYVTLASMLRDYLPGVGVSFDLRELAEDLEETPEQMCAILDDLRQMETIEFTIEESRLTIQHTNTNLLSVGNYRETFGEDAPVNPAELVA